MEVKVKTNHKSFSSRFVRWKNCTRQEKIVLPLFHLALLVFAVWMILPVFFALLNSFKPVDAYYSDPMEFPKVWQWSNYKNALQLSYRNTGIVEMFFNSLFFMITYSGGNILANVLMAYAIAKFDFRGKNLLYNIAIVVQILPIFGSTGAGYILMDNLGMIDNMATFWLCNAMGFGYSFLILHSYFVGVDKSYSEAAEIDGAGQWRIFLQIVLPMVLPAILLLWLNSAIGVWNDYLTPLVYLPSNPTLSTGLYNLKATAAYVEGGTVTYFAALVIGMIPIMILFLLTQRKIFTIDVSGGVKG